MRPSWRKWATESMLMGDRSLALTLVCVGSDSQLPSGEQFFYHVVYYHDILTNHAEKQLGSEIMGQNKYFFF